MKVETNSIEYQILMERLKNDGVIDKFSSLYIFQKDGRFQEVIHLLKYKNIKSIGIRLGRELGEKIRNEMGKIDCVVSIPLHRLKLKERGYNQVDCICLGISNELGIKFKRDILVRNRYTRTQTELNFQERKENVKDAFDINDKYINELRDKVAIVVDDVITTGATITSAGKVLKDNGCKAVYAASVGLASL